MFMLTVFNPVIHEPLSKVDCSCLGLVTEKASHNSLACNAVRDGDRAETSSGASLQEDLCSELEQGKNNGCTT